MKSKFNLVKTAILLTTCLFLSVTSFTQDGSLDLSFDFDGIVTTSIGNGNDEGNSVVIQSDGKILLVGTSGVYFALARYNENGSLDNSFGTSGKVTTLISPGNAVASSVALQSDKKIVIAGYNGIFPNYDIVVARYMINGTLDTSFSSDGIATTSIGTFATQARSVAIQPDGKIVVTGNYNNGSNADIILVRYNINGSLDNTFDSDGIVTTSVGPANEIGRSVAIQKDEKILVTGYSYTPSSFAYEFVLARYETNGRLDSTFNSDGILTTDFVSENDYGESIVLQSDGKIVVGGYSFTGYLCLVRYNSNGSLDNTFGINGKATTAFACAYQNDYSTVIQSDGKILLGGYSTLNSNNSHFALARYTSTGKLDSTFDLDGIVNTPIGSGNDVATSVALQNDGKIVLAGNSFNGTNYDFAVVRYNNKNTSGIHKTANKSTEINIYPNPFLYTTTVQINYPITNATLKVYNSYGQQVKQIDNIFGQTIPLDRDNLPSGLYFIELSKDNKTLTNYPKGSLRNKLLLTD